MGILILVPTETERRLLLSGNRYEESDVGLCGVGLVNAAANTARLVVARSPNAVLLLGICGAYADSGVSVCDVVRVDQSYLTEFGAEESDGSFLLPTKLGLGDPLWKATDARRFPDVDFGLRERFLQAPSVSSASVQKATGTLKTAQQRLTHYPVQIEEMEGAAVLAVCHAFGVPVFHVRAVSNLAGPRDRASWKIAEAMDALGSWLGREDA
jgi:futalosine hydrolase